MPRASLLRPPMIGRLLATAAGALLLLANPAGAAEPQSNDDAEASRPPKKTPELLEQGRASFQRNCASCHGEKGAGDGFAAAGLNPKPRNFTTDPFKNGGRPPEVFETLKHGVPGTAMVPFLHLSEQERWALAYWVEELRQSGQGKKK
jgi:mono/diheme cytochrome c family protein